MELDRFPIFIGNERASEMEIGSFGVGSKTFQGSALPGTELFAEWSGNVLDRSDAKSNNIWKEWSGLEFKIDLAMYFAIANKTWENTRNTFFSSKDRIPLGF